MAKIYCVTTGHLNQKVKRNLDRFPEDFMFQLSEIEEESLISQFVISKSARGGRQLTLIPEPPKKRIGIKNDD